MRQFEGIDLIHTYIQLPCEESIQYTVVWENIALCKVYCVYSKVLYSLCTYCITAQ